MGTRFCNPKAFLLSLKNSRTSDLVPITSLINIRPFPGYTQFLETMMWLSSRPRKSSEHGRIRQFPSRGSWMHKNCAIVAVAVTLFSCSFTVTAQNSRSDVPSAVEQVLHRQQEAWN